MKRDRGHIDSVRTSINNPEQKALLISDLFRAQHTHTLKDLMTANNCILQKVPVNMTHHLQPLDISINGLAKKFMRNKYEDWYAKNIVCQLNGGVSSDNVKIDTRFTVIREVHARWINELFVYLKGRPDDIRKGFEKSGITDACRSDLTVDDNPFADLV